MHATVRKAALYNNAEHRPVLRVMGVEEPVSVIGVEEPISVQKRADGPEGEVEGNGKRKQHGRHWEGGCRA